MNNSIKKILPALSGRMKTVAEMVSNGSSAADIGCDHGYVSIYLYNSGRCKRCIAADIKRGPLSRAKANVEAYGAKDGVEIRLSNGLKNIRPGEADCIIISGMGASTITDILSSAKEKTAAAKELILEPQSDADKVRRYLYSHGFAIVQEALVEEKGKYYPVIKAVPSKSPEKLSEEEYVYGPCLLKNRDSLLLRFLKKEKERVEKIMSPLKEITGEAASSRIRELESELETIQRAMERYTRIILASGSPRRRELLAQIGIKTEVMPSCADENVDIDEPSALVEELSRRKCADVAKDFPSGIILGADTVVAVDNEILGKPADAADAKRMLRLISGRTHQVYTGVTIIKKAAGNCPQKITFHRVTNVTIAALEDKEIDEYIASGEPMDKAGGYGIQGVFAKYIERVDGDYSNVVGLPLAAVYAVLKKL